RVLIGMRDIFEAMSAVIGWDAATRTVTAEQGATTIRLTIGSATAYVNEEAVTLQVPAQIINESTYVPLRFVAEATGAKVQWIGATRTVDVKTGAGDGMPPIESTGPAVLSAPVVTAPTAGQTVGPAVNVTGRTAGGATIRIITYVNMRVDDAEVSKIPGIVHNVPVDGTFDFRIALPSVRGHELDELYYDIHVWMVDGGEQSDPTIVRVYRD
ncbi:MAG TPA: copper amine oxidase N-terminal domain-containing protein, partial [Armatimonadota bacterium]|nr:copper amine oxidase N-terminal domain-containing protein [Armatimonadota bacterium]